MNIESDKMNTQIFEKGISMGFFDMTKEQANEWVKNHNQDPQNIYAYDWHYIGGRIHVKRLLKSELIEI